MKTRLALLQAILLVVAGLGPVGAMPACRPPSVHPPGGLTPPQAPQFVCFGSDDNSLSGHDGSAGGFAFLTDLFAEQLNPTGCGNAGTYDGTPASFSFYANTIYISESQEDDTVRVKRAWREAIEAGCEVGVHTHSHPHGGKYGVKKWSNEIAACLEWLTKPFDPGEREGEGSGSAGVGAAIVDIRGFRAPYLEFNDAAFKAMEAYGLEYDCSLREGMQEDQDGTDYLWPYTLDKGSPGNRALAGVEPQIGSHPGLWEVPVYSVIVPPDGECARYGVAPGLRARLARRKSYFDPAQGKITGMDWIMWTDLAMNRAEFVATLKYTLDLRLKGNRCPFTLCIHSDLYSDRFETSEVPNATPEERRRALREFLDYALTKQEVRVVSTRLFLQWLQNPVELSR